MKLPGNLIILRHPDRNDIDDITRYCSDKAISQFTFIPYPYTRHHAEDFVEHAAHERKENTGLHLAIMHKDTGEVIGMIGLNVINELHQRAEIGYWVAKPFWGQGIATEAVTLMSRHCFNDLGLERLYAYVQPENEASWKLLEKCGYEREGLLKRLMRRGDKRVDHYIYAKLKAQTE